jgi:hypothetical protein
MSFRTEMLQVARLAPRLLDSATPLVADFLHRSRSPEGAWPDRDGKPDVYYTVFGIEGLMALHQSPDHPALAPWLDSLAGQPLDFVHLCCLARCWATLPKSLQPTESLRKSVASRLLTDFQTPDGGFHQRPGSPLCSAYGCLLGWSALADLGLPSAPTEKITNCLQSLATPDGAYANEPGLPLGTTTATAAAISLHRILRRQPPDSASSWLLSQFHPAGGFKAFPHAPIPDLLSTAVTLHALDGTQTPFPHLKDPLLDFIDSLWSADGGFHGNWTDDSLDVEYTYYGLLALGHLAL